MASGDPVTRFHLQPTETRAGRVALVTIDNGADWRKPYTFGPDALGSLAAVLDELEGGDWSGLLVTGKPLVFAAGADITQFPGITPERARQGGQAGHALFGRVRALPFPTLAAVNGAALELVEHLCERPEGVGPERVRLAPVGAVVDRHQGDTAGTCLGRLEVEAGDRVAASHGAGSPRGAPPPSRARCRARSARSARRAAAPSRRRAAPRGGRPSPRAGGRRRSRRRTG